MRTGLTTLLAIASALLSGCGGGDAGKTLTVKGSDTMVALGGRWAEQFMLEHRGVVVQVMGGGSGTGINALVNGGTDICQSSRPMTDKERAQVKQRFGKEVKEIPVALDGITIYVNETNRTPSVTLAQLKAVYTGKITNWKELGGEDLTIVAYGRENNSGTYMYFKEHVLGGDDFAVSVQALQGTGGIVSAVSKDERAIGYGGVGYAVKVRELPVRKDESSDPVLPTEENVVSGKYPISRSLYFYTVGEPEGLTKEYIDWVLSPEGQKICKHEGYFPVARQ